MRTGDFEYCGEEFGLPVYRVRWREEDAQAEQPPGLSEEERRRALFIRYLISKGKVGEGVRPKATSQPSPG